MAYTYKQPDYQDLWHAYVDGAKDARLNPTATEEDFNRAADAYCKLVHQRLDPELFNDMATGNFKV